MLYGAFSRGTTPTHTFLLSKKLTTNDLVDYTIVYRQKNKNILIKHPKDAHKSDDTNNHSIILTLSKNDTLMFDPRFKRVDVQIKGETKNGDVLIVGDYTFRLDDCFEEDVLSEDCAAAKSEENSKKGSEHIIQNKNEVNDLMYKYASLCNDILQECQKIKEEMGGNNNG